MTEFSQPRHRFYGYSGFERENAVASPGFETKAGTVEGFLRVKIIIEHCADDLEMSLGLHKTAHDTKTRPQLTIFDGHTRNNGVIRTFAASQRIGVRRIKAETCAAILQK